MCICHEMELQKQAWCSSSEPRTGSERCCGRSSCGCARSWTPEPRPPAAAAAERGDPPAMLVGPHVSRDVLPPCRAKFVAHRRQKRVCAKRRMQNCPSNTVHRPE